MSKNAPVVLMILDGWGYSEENKHNAIAAAYTPQWDQWWASKPHMLLQASGTPVGLPNAQMGNSEVGHMHIGAGRLVRQDFTRINHAIETGEFQTNPIFKHTLDNLKKTGRTLHIMGLFSPGGVHSHEQHLYALLALCAKEQFSSVCLHLFLDGRDTPPQSVLSSLTLLKNQLVLNPVGVIASITGRYYAMDRDNRWERIEPVYNLLTQAESMHHFGDAEGAINFFYAQKVSDEFISPTAIGSPKPVVDGDAMLYFNFRADRARQLTAAFVDPEFKHFNRKKTPKLSAFISMTEYDNTLATQVLFPPTPLRNTLGEVIANHGLTQLRIAETEKYAHVTFFLNGGVERVFPNEDRLLIPSPKVATYDLKPEMSAPELTLALIDAIKSKRYDVIICNYANADMVGHSGNFTAAVHAVECLDKCMSQVGRAVAEQQGCLLITADHGNVEEMFDESTHQSHTAHTSEPVPLLFVGEQWHFTQNDGSLVDIAPTVLTLLGIKPPAEMTGHVLLAKINE